MHKLTLSLIVFAILVSLFGTQKSIQAQSPTEEPTYTPSLNIEHVSDDQIPESMKKLGFWKLQFGMTGWFVDFSQAQRWQKYVIQTSKDFWGKWGGTTVHGYVTNPNPNVLKKVQRNFIDRFVKLLKTPEYNSQDVYAIDQFTGRTIKLPHYAVDNLPVVVVENFDYTYYGSNGHPKGVYSKTAYGVRDVFEFVRVYNPKTNILQIRRYFIKLSTDKYNSDPHYGENLVFLMCVEWGYLGNIDLGFYSSGRIASDYLSYTPDGAVGYEGVFVLDGDLPVIQSFEKNGKYPWVQ